MSLCSCQKADALRKQRFFQGERRGEKGERGNGRVGEGQGGEAERKEKGEGMSKGRKGERKVEKRRQGRRRERGEREGEGKEDTQTFLLSHLISIHLKAHDIPRIFTLCTSEVNKHCQTVPITVAVNSIRKFKENSRESDRQW